MSPPRVLGSDVFRGLFSKASFLEEDLSCGFRVLRLGGHPAPGGLPPSPSSLRRLEQHEDCPQAKAAAEISSTVGWALASTNTSHSFSDSPLQPPA